jgi:hypothetical protein
MANKVAKIVKLEAKKYNKTRKILKPVGVTLKLQTKDGDDDTFTDLSPEITDDFWYEYDSFREKIRVKVAKYNDSTFESNLLLASDALIGSDRYEIDKRDITVPDADRPYWRFYCIMNQENY